MNKYTKNKTWRIVAVIIACILLIYWLFIATDMNADDDTDYSIESVTPAAE